MEIGEVVFKIVERRLLVLGSVSFWYERLIGSTVDSTLDSTIAEHSQKNGTPTHTNLAHTVFSP